MGCSSGCMVKVRKVFALTPKSANAHRIGTDFKLLIYIVDYLPLKDLIRFGRSNRYDFLKSLFY